MLELGAGYGRWIVNAAAALRAYGGLSHSLTAVEAESRHRGVRRRGARPPCDEAGSARTHAARACRSHRLDAEREHARVLFPAEATLIEPGADQHSSSNGDRSFQAKPSRQGRMRGHFLHAVDVVRRPWSRAVARDQPVEHVAGVRARSRTGSSFRPGTAASPRVALSPTASRMPFELAR
jgi:hypothetical protein